MVQKDTKPNSQSKYLSDSDSDDNEIDPRIKASIEEDNIIQYQDQL